MEHLSVSVPEELASQIREAAREDGTTLSAWLGQAAESKLLLRNALRAVADWEREHGEITDEQLAQMERTWRG